MVKNQLNQTEDGMRYVRMEMSGAVLPSELRGGGRGASFSGTLPMLLVADDTTRVPSETRRAASDLTLCGAGRPVAAVASDDILRAALQFIARASGALMKVFASEEDAMRWLQAEALYQAQPMASAA